MSYDTGFSRRSGSERDLQSVAITSVDPVSRFAVGVTRTRHTVRINCAYATGDTITTPAVGEQWYCERFGGEWRLYGRIPFNDATLNIEPEEGQVLVGSASGPLELNGTEVRSNGTVFRLNGVYYRDDGETLQRSTDKEVWEPISGTAAGAIQLIGNALSGIPVTEDVAGFLERLGDEETETLQALAEWAQGLGDEIGNAWNVACDNPFFTSLRELGSGDRPIDQVVTGFQAFINDLWGTLFCGFTGNLTPQTALTGLGGISGLLAANPLVQGLADLIGDSAVGNLAVDAISGATEFLQQLVDLLLCNFTGELTPQGILDAIGEVLTPLTESPFIQGLSSLADTLGTGVGNLFQDAIAGATGLVQAVFGAIFCDFSGDFTPQAMIAKLTEVLTSVTENPFVAGLISFAEGLGHTVGGGIEKAFAGANELLEALFGVFFCDNEGVPTPQVILDSVSGVVDYIRTNPLVAGLVEFIEGVGTTSTGFLQKALEGAFEFFNQIVNTIFCNLPGQPKPADIMASLVAVIASVTDNPYVAMLRKVAEFAGDTSTNLIQQLMAGITGIFDWFVDLLNTLIPFFDWNQIKTLDFPAMMSGLLDGLNPLVTINDVVDWVEQATGVDFSNGPAAFVTSLFTALQDSIAEVFTTISGVLTWIEEQTGLDFTDPVLFLSSLVTKLVGDVNGFVAGISGALWNLTEFVNDLWAGMNQATGLTWHTGPIDFLNSLVQKILADLGINLSNPEALFGSLQGALVTWIESVTGVDFSGTSAEFVASLFSALQNSIAEVFTTISGVLTWIEEQTGLDFTDPVLFLSSLVTRLVGDVEGFVTQVSNALWNLAGFANDLWSSLNQATGLTWDTGPLDFITSLVQKITDDFQINLGSPEDLFNSIQSNIGTVFTTIGGVLEWIQEKTGLDFTDPTLFLGSLVTKLVGDVEGFITGVSGALWSLGDFADGLWGALNDATGLVWDQGLAAFTESILSAITNGVQDLITAAVSGFVNAGQVATQITSAVSDFITYSMLNLGTELVWDEGPLNFIQSLIDAVLGGFEVDLNGPYELWASITNPLETILGLSEGALTNFLGNLTVFFNGLPNIFDGSFNLQSAVQSFLTDTLGIAQIGAAGLQFVESLIPNVLGALDDFFDNVASFLGIDLRQIASGDFIPGLAFITFLTNIKDVLLEWIRFYVFGGVQSIGEWVEDSIFNPIAQTFLGGLKLPPALLGVTEIAEAGLGVLGDIAGTLLTSLTAIPATLLEGILPPGLLGQIPVSNISDTSPNLINLGAFAEAGNIEASDDWSWDANNNFPGSSGGSAKLVISTAGNRHLYSRQAVPVGGGDRLVLSARVMSSGLTVNPSGSTPIYISLIPFIGTSQQSAIPVGTARGATTSWNSIGNTADDPYVVTNADWTSVIVRLTVASTATAGTVWWDEVSLTKTGKLVQDNVDSLIDAWNSMIGGLEGLGENVSGFDWTRLFTAAANARQQGTVAQERLNNTNTNLFGTPLGGTTFAPETLPTLISNLAAIKVDGNETMSGFLDGLLDAFGGQLPPGTAASVAEVVNSAASVTNTAEVANTAAGTANTNLQVTWNDLFDAFNGSSGSTGKTSANARERGAAVRTSAVTGETNAATALTNAATAQGTANTAQGAAATADAKAVTAQSAAAAADAKAVTADGKAVSAQSAAATADSKAVVAQDLTRTSIAAGANIATNGDFERDTYIGVNAVRSTESPRTGSYSAKITQPGNYYGFVFQAVTDTGHVPYPVSAGDKFYVEFWARGLPTNASTSGNIWFQMNLARSDGLANTGTTTAFTALNDLHDGEWHLCSGTMTIPAYSYECLSSFVVTNHLAPAGNVYYVDNVRFYRITEAFDANVDADAAQATANTGVANAATAQSSANTAQSTANTASTAASNAQSTANTANTAAGTANTNLQTTWNDLFDAFNGSSGSTGKTSANARDRGAAVRNSAVTGEANASTALTNAATADGKAVVAQSAAATADAKAVAAQALLDASTNAGANMIPDPSFENSAFDAKRLATTGSYAPWFTHTTEQKHSGTRSVKLTLGGQTWPSMNLTPSLNRAVSGDRSTWIPTAPGRTYYVSQWVYLKSPNAGTRETSLYLMTYNEGFTTAGYQLIQAFPPLDTWTQISGYITITDSDAAYMVPLFGAFRPGNDTGAVMYLDDVVLIDVTDAYNAKVLADAAQAQANTATTNAATADAKAVTADGKAVTADSKAVVAQSVIDGLATSNNRVISPNFEDSTVARMKWLGFNNGTIDYTTDESVSGTQSLRYTINTVGWNGFWLAPTPTKYRTACKPGDTISASLMVKGKATNATAGYMYLYIRFLNTGAGGGQTDAAGGAWYTNLAVWNGDWLEMTNVGTCPAGHDAYEVFWIANGGAAAGNVYYFDNAVVREETTARTALTNAASAQAQANTATTNAATADSKAGVAKSLANSALRAGPNLATNPSFENSNLAIRKSLSNYSTDQARTGIQSFKTAGYTYSYMFSDENGWINLPCTPGDTYAVEIWVYGHQDNATITGGYATAHFQTYNTAGALLNTTYIGGLYLSAAAANAAKGVWTKLAGTITIPANAASFQVTAAISNFTPSNVTFYWDDFACYRITEAQAAQLDADAAQADASTGIANAATADAKAVTADAKAVTADGKAVTADGKAVVAQAVAATALTTGANLATNPGFENTNLYINYSATHRRYSTEQAHSGATSFKMSNYTWVELFSDTTQYVRLPCSPGDRFYAEIWVLGHASNAATTRDAYLQAGSWDVDGNVVNGAINITGWTDANFPQWTKLSGEFTVGANAATFMVAAVQLSGSGDGSGNTYYWDDFKCYRITEAYNAQLDADAAQADANTGIANAAIAKTQADLGVSNAAAADQKAIVAQQRIEEWASAGASLSTNPGFEDTSQHLGNGWAYSTEQAYSGTRSAKYVSDGSTYVALSATATSSTRLGIKVRPDQVFYLEAYVRGHTNNTATGSSGISLVGVFYRNDLTGPYIVTATTVGATQVGKDNWVKLSGTVIVPADRQLFYPRLDISGSTIPSGNAYYVDWFNTFDITDAYYAQRDVDAATELLNAAVTSGANLIPDPSFENPNLDAARKATSGSVANWWTFVTDVVKTGSRAAEITLASIPAYPSLNLVPSLKPAWSTDPNIRVPCRPGQVFYLSQWVYLRSPNTGSREVNLYLATFNAANTIVYQVVQAYPALDTWTKIEGYFVVNRADVTGVVPLFGAFRPSNALNSKAVFDDVVMVDVTDAYYAQQEADAARADANTGIANAAIAKTQADLGVSNAAAAQSTANTARTAIDNAISAGSNLCTNPGAENTSLPINGYNGLVSYSTDYARNGSRSIKFVAANSDNYSYWLFGNTSTWNVWMPCAEGDVFYFEAYVRGVPANTHNFPPYFRLTVMKGSTSNPTYEYPSVHYGIDGVRAESLYTASQINNGWQKITAVWTAPAGSFQFQPYLQVHVSVPQGNTYYADDFKCYRITEAQAANHEAQVAKGISSSVVASADNLCANGDFENTDYLLEALSYTTDEKFSGTRSAALTTLVGWKGAFPVVNSDGSRTRFPCAPGDVFDIRAAIKAKATNVSVSGCWVQITFYTAAGSAIQTQNPIYKQCDPGGFDWLERSGITSPAPANAASVQVSFLSNSPTAGDVIYFDALRLYRITDAYNAQQDADAAQADASTGIANAQTAQTAADAADTKAVVAQKDISNTALSSNLIPDPTFIDPNIQRYGYSSVTPTYTTEESYVGGRCLTWTSAGSTWQGPYFSALQSSKQRFRCSPGDTFNIKLKIKYKSTNNMSAGYVRIFIRFWQSANGGTYTDRVAGTYQRSNASFGGTGWLDMNCWGVCPDDRSAVEIFIINDPSTPNGNVYYIDAVRLEQTGPAQEITDTVTQAIAGGSTTGNSLATLKLKVTETKTQADLGVANAGTAQSTTEEVKLALYGSATAAPSTAIQAAAVPALPQSKITGLPTDLTNLDNADKATNNAIYNGFYGSGGTGSAANVSTTIGAIKEKLETGYTVQSITTTGTWTRPWTAGSVDEPTEFWAIAIGSGSGGGRGRSTITGAAGGVGGIGGRWLAKQIDPADVPSTVSVTIAAGGAGTNSGLGNAAPDNGGDTSFGTLCATSSTITASIASQIGYYSAEDSRPGSGGNGGNEAGGSQPGSPGEATPLAAGGAAGQPSSSSAVRAGSAGGNASVTGSTRAGGGGGGGGAAGFNVTGGTGGNGGWPGGGGGGGGATYTINSTSGGPGGNGGNGAVILLWK